MPPLSFALYHLQKSLSTRIRSIHISCFLGPVSNTMDKCGLRYIIFLMFIANDISSESIFIPENQSPNEEARFHLWQAYVFVEVATPCSIYHLDDILVL